MKVDQTLVEGSETVMPAKRQMRVPKGKWGAKRQMGRHKGIWGAKKAYEQWGIPMGKAMYPR